jgi:hypothetical protein
MRTYTDSIHAADAAIPIFPMYTNTYDTNRLPLPVVVRPAQNNLFSADAFAASLFAVCFFLSLASRGGLKNKLGLSFSLSVYARYPRCAGSR